MYQNIRLISQKLAQFFVHNKLQDFWDELQLNCMSTRIFP